MTPELLLQLLISWWPWIYLKLFFLIFFVLYIIFASILFRQIDLMNQMIEAQISPLLKLIGLIHLIAAISLFLLALMML